MKCLISGLVRCASKDVTLITSPRSRAIIMSFCAKWRIWFSNVVRFAGRRLPRNEKGEKLKARGKLKERGGNLERGDTPRWYNPLPAIPRSPLRKGISRSSLMDHFKRAAQMYANIGGLGNIGLTPSIPPYSAHISWQIWPCPLRPGGQVFSKVLQWRWQGKW